MLGISKAAWFIILTSRIVLNLSYRITYPYLPQIARGLGISFETAGLLVAARSFIGITGVFFGLLSERKGYRWGMCLGLFCLVAGAALVGWTSSFSAALVGFLFLGVAKTIYDPAVQSYVSFHSPYQLRARAIGIIESSWATSWFIGIPLCGFLIARMGWNSPFLIIAVLGLLAFTATTRLPRSTLQQPNHPSAHPIDLPVSAAPPISRRNAMVVMWVSFFMLLANENMMIVYGIYLESVFSLKVEALGIYSTWMGIAELAGEMTVALAVDRLGKKRAFASGLLLTALGYALLPVCRSSLAGTMVVLMFMFYLFEFTIVSSFTYVSELVPEQRAKWLAINYSFCVAGRLCGALIGPRAWNLAPGIWPNAAIAIIGNGIASLLLYRIRRTRQSTGDIRNPE